MMKSAPNPVDVQDFQFHLQYRLKIFENTEIAPFAKHCNAIAAASRFGLLFVSTNTSNFQVIQVKSLENYEYSRSDGPKSDYPKRIVTLEAPVRHLSVNCEHTILAVVSERDSCCFAQFYDVKSFYQQTIRKIDEIRLSSTPGVNVVDIGWNPTLGLIFTACKSDGSLTVCELKNPGIEINELPAQANASCFCWSPKGKQIAVGSKDGKITQYKPDLKAVKVINSPLINNVVCFLVALQWVSNYQFIGVFQQSTSDGQVSVVVVDAPKTGPVEFTNYDDICYSNGNARPVQFYMILQQHWNILMMASSNSMEVGVMGLTNTSWMQWIMGDAYRAELPLHNNQQDTLPIGLALDTSSTQSVLFGDNNLPPAPLLFLLSHFGVLCCFKVIYSKTTVGVCSPPDPIADLSGLGLFIVDNKPQLQQQLKAASFAETKQATPKPESVPFVATKQATPKPENVPFVAAKQATPKPESVPFVAAKQATLKPESVSFATPVAPKPPAKFQVKQEEVKEMKSEEINRIDEENEVLFGQLVKDECLFLDSQIKQIIKEGKLIDVNLGTEEDKTKIVKITEALEIFLDLVVETCTTQNSEIHTLKQNLLQSWVWFEEAKSRYEQAQDGTIKILLKCQPLDSVSEKQLNDIRHSSYYLESQLVQANRALDEQWEMFQDYCRKTYKTQLPTMEAIFQAMVKQNAIIQKQNYILKDLGSKIKNRPRPALGSPLLLSLDNANELENELKKLRLSSEDICEIQYEQIMNRRKKLSDGKVKKLGDFLRNRTYPVNSTVKPQCTTTPLSKTSKELAILGAKMSPLPTDVMKKVNFNQIKDDSIKNQDVPKTIGLLPTKGILPSSNSAFASTTFVVSTTTTTINQPVITISTNAKSFNFGTASTIPSTTKSTFSFSTAPNPILGLLNNKSVTISPVVPKTDVGVAKPFSFTALNKTQSITTVKSQPLIFTSTPFVTVTAKPTSTTPSSTANPMEPSSLFATIAPKTTSVVTSIVSSSTTPSTNKMFAPVKTTSTIDFSNVSTSEPPVFVTAKSPTMKSGTASGSVVPKSIFPVTTTTLNNLFGSITTSPVATSAQSFFGSSSQKSGTTSIFGGSSTLSTTPSIFSNVSATNTTTSSIFGAAAVTSTTPSKNIFGGVTTSSAFSTNAQSGFVTPVASTSVSSSASIASTVFGNSTATSATSVFTTPTSSTPATISSTPSGFGTPTTSTVAFGTSSSTTSPSVFSTPLVGTTAPSVFGTPLVGTTTPSAFGTPIVGTTASSGFATPSAVPATTAFSTPTSTTVVSSSLGTPSTATTVQHVFATTPSTTIVTTVFGTSPATSATVPSVFGAQTTTTPSVFATVSTATAPGIFSTPTSVPSAFNTNAPVSSVFGGPTATSSIFGGVTTSSGTGQSVFGGSSTATAGSIFGNTTAAAAPMFGTTVTTQSMFGSTASMTAATPGLFVSTPSTTAQGFGTFVVQKSVFGSTPSTSNSSFGTTSTSQSSVFGNAQQPSVFGSPSSASSTFGQSASIFGQSPSFNQQQQQQQSAFSGSPTFGGSPSFGQTTSMFANVPATSAPSGSLFGNTPITSSAFGSTGTVFGTPVSSASVFGSPPASSSSFGFASPTSTNSFGFGGLNVGSTTTTSTGFGSGFEQQPQQQQTVNPFGQKSIFGTPATSSVNFGQSTFGQSPSFGSTTSTFGNNTSLFGQPQQQQSSTFGQSVFGNTFGSQQPSGPFSGSGTGVGQTGFGAAAATNTASFQKSANTGFGGAPVFGAPQPAFGGAPSFGGAPAFGSTAAFGSPSKIFGGASPTGFGSPAAPTQNPSFGNLANQNTVGFGSLAQQATNPQSNSAFSGNSSFSSWR